MNTEQQHGKSTLMSPGNVILGICLLLGLFVAVLRFSQGLAGVTNLNDTMPWGAWVFLNLVLAACFTSAASVATFSYYFLGLPYARVLVRPALLLSLVGFAAMVAVSLLDLGQPWRILYPILCSQGATSTFFGVAVCTLLSIIAIIFQLVPSQTAPVGKQTVPWMIGLAACTIVLTALFQGALGSLFLIAPSKMHPLWFSSHLPLLFLGSGFFGAMALIILASLMAHAKVKDMESPCQSTLQDAMFGLAKAASFIMMAYVVFKFLSISINNAWGYLATGYGALFFTEVVLFVALPSFMFAIGVREKKLCITKMAAIITLLGVVLNRLCVSIIAFNAQLDAADRYCPAWQELALIAFVFALIAAGYRFFSTKLSIHGHDAKDAC